MKEFELLKGEKIIYHTKPLPILKWYFYFGSIYGLFFLFIFLMFFALPFIAIILSTRIDALFEPLGMFISTFGIVILLLDYIIASKRYNKRYYWITSKRLIFKQGLFGYTINSVPLERISDVLISRSFVENIFGFGSLQVQSLAGQITGKGRGAEVVFNAIPDPEKNQKLILELVKKKRKEEHITM